MAGPPEAPKPEDTILCVLQRSEKGYARGGARARTSRKHTPRGMKFVASSRGGLQGEAQGPRPAPILIWDDDGNRQAVDQPRKREAG